MIKERRNIRYYWIIGCCLMVLAIVGILIQNPVWVERWYSKGVYPIYAYIPKVLFGWVPFSVGDLLYIAFLVFVAYQFVYLAKSLFECHWADLWHVVVKLLASILMVYSLFYLGWGTNYFRQTLAQQFDLDVDGITPEDYEEVLQLAISKANFLREQIHAEALDRRGVRQEMEDLFRADTLFSRMLCKSQVKGKQPISSNLVSYFMVTGYFNPFTHEVQVNQNIPLMSYPFTSVHELAHQAGVGFEDECNFIAFQLLHEHPDPWYAYSAYYEAIQSLIRPVRMWDKAKYDRCIGQLSPLIREDLRQERLFWEQYTGWIDRVSDVFYNRYLQHNNQPEGINRYGMMNRLIIAWQKNKQSD